MTQHRDNPPIKKLRCFILLIASLIFILNCELNAQESASKSLQEIQKKVNRYIEWMTRKENPIIWDAALRLQELGKDAIPIIKDKISTLPEMAKVGCCKALVGLEELDTSIETLLDVLKNGNDNEAKVEAASLIGIAGDYELEKDLQGILDTTFNPYVKIALSKALWQVARSMRASKELKGFLNSEDARLRYEAAIALAEINDIEAAKPVLAEIKEEPTLRGRLAKALLSQDTLIKKYERMLDSSKVPSKEVKKGGDYPLIDEVIKKIKDFHINGDKFTQKELVEYGVKGMLVRTDRHSNFWREKEWEEYKKEMKEEGYIGIGIYVGIRDGSFTVISPIYSGPAYKAGIRSMDRIIEVNGWPTAGKPVDEIVKIIKEGSEPEVKLKVYREGWSKVRDFTVPKQRIRIPSVFSKLLPQKIGYIRLTQFAEKTSQDMENSLKEMEGQGMGAFILDLRGNGGGWFRAARDIVSMFLPSGKLIVFSKGRSEEFKRIDYNTDNPHPHPAYPIIILVDHSSASASEIVAGSLQCHKRAILVGTLTYGKGSIQQLFFLESCDNKAVLKLTVARYYLPDERSIHTETDPDGKVLKQGGIEPDIKVDYENEEPWKNEEKSKLEEKQAFKEYIKKYYENNKALFHKLSDNDELSTSEYPDFDEWYKSLDTRATKDDVRSWLRKNLRQLVADEIGKEYVCDYTEDIMLQRAIVEICKDLKVNPKSITEYKVFSERFDKK